MAKKQKVILPNPPSVWNPSFYAHYDEETGNILSVSNEKLEIHTHSLEITFTAYENFVLNRHKLSDFKVENNELVSTIIEQPKIKINKLREIYTSIDADIEIYYGKEWIFLLNDNTRQKYYDKKILGDDITIFFTSADDRNYLIKSFKLSFKDLILDKIVIPLEDETKYTNFSLLTNSELTYNLNKSIHE